MEKNAKEESHKILNQPMQAMHIGIAPSNSNNLLVASPAAANPVPASLRVPISGKKDNGATMFRTETTIPHVPYNELTIATKNWNTYNILGKGGFGIVYRGNENRINKLLNVY